MKLRYLYNLKLLGLMLWGLISLAQNPADYEQRRTDYIDQALSNFSSAAITLQAYRGDTVDQEAINDILNSIPTKSTIDFSIVKLVRVLLFTDTTAQGQMLQNQILPALQTIPFWINKGDTLRGYWSENHMIMWMSSHWLLHQKYGSLFPIDTSLDDRLRHYLELKVNYGFYEFFSSTYAPYCLSGLLNLADFAQDQEIKSMAAKAATRLLKDLLMVTNDQGVFFPAAGRNYYGKYENAYGQNHNNLIFLLTGMGEAPLQASHSGGFLASSSIPVDSIIVSWTPYMDTIYSIGHSLDSGFVINSNQTWLDRVIFQWSSGAYFHPKVVEESVTLLNDSVLWDQVDFRQLGPLRVLIPSSGVREFAEELSAISKSSVSSGQDVAIFKNNSVTLASIQDYWKGKVGYQQFPCVATVGTTAVLTASGTVKEDWEDRNSNNANEHLPYISQQSNVALLMYRPEAGNILLKNKDVALRWTDADFDEIREEDKWLLGRQGESYIGVRRHCVGEKKGIRACEDDRGQTWVIVVGNSDLHSSFSDFQTMISQSQFEEQWYYDSTISKAVYYAKIVVDNKTIDHAWERDGPLETGIDDQISDGAAVNVFPNPAPQRINIDLTSFGDQNVAVTVLDMLGKKMYYETLNNPGFEKLDVSGWPRGIYMLLVESESGFITMKFVKD